MKFPINQVIAAILCHLGAFNCGLVIGWLSPALPQLLSPTSPIGTVTLEQSAWLAAIVNLPGILASPLSTFITEYYGRKVGVIVGTIPFFLNGLLIMLATDINILILSRFLGGLGMIITLCNNPTYIGEIADVNFRGILGSLLVVFSTIGITASYALGGFISYKAVGLAICIVASINFVFFFYMPDTPTFLVKNNKIDDAIKAISWLQNIDPDSAEVKSELENLRSSSNYGSMSVLDGVKVIVMSKPVRKGFIICMFMFLAQCTSGVFVIHNYAQSIFAESGASNLSPQLASVIYGCIQILGATSTMWIVDRYGRKILLATSLFGVGLCMITMGTFFYFKDTDVNVDSINWLPLLTLCLCVYIYTVGGAPIPFVLLLDYIPSEVKSIATSMALSTYNLVMFFLLKYYEPIVALYGRYVAFYFFALSTVTMGIFTLLCIKETKGKSVTENIDNNYGFKKKFVISQKLDNIYI